MRHAILLTSAISLAASQAPQLFAEEGELPFEIHNRLRLEHDDNIYETSSNKQDSLKIIEEPIIRLNHSTEGSTFIGVDYMPSLIYWFDRDSDDTDIQHQLDASLNHGFSPNVSLSLKDIFRVSQLPELTENDVVVRNNNDYMYNSINAALGLGLSNTMSLDLEGRYVILSYDDDAAADANDYDQTSAGVNLKKQLSPNSVGAVQFRATQYDYEDDLRDTDSIQVGVSLSQVLSKTVVGDFRAGFEQQDYDSASKDSAESPYADVGLVISPNPNTRFNVGVGYSLSQTPTSKFTAQERTTLRAGLAQKLSGRLGLKLNGSYSTGTFDVDQSTSAFDATTDTDGDENVVRLSAKLDYELNKRNYLEAGVQYLDLDSDVRAAQNYDRTRASIGWRTVLK